MEAHSLSEVNKYIRQVIALNFEDSIWVNAEISQIKGSGAHYYLDLIEKDELSGEVIASVSAVIWYKAYNFIKTKLGDLSTQILSAGTQIQAKVKVDFHEKYGMKFVIEDIDPAFTFGQLELERQKTIERLQKEDRIAKNTLTNLPLVIQNIAIISSEGAAGFQDFKQQLEQNPFAYTFHSTLFNASVQGSKLEKDILSNLDRIEQTIEQFDCVVIIRGGGSKLDLSGFDSYLIAKAVADFPIPVITGIGHDVDQNVIELVAHSPLKTPTAAADHILEHNERFEYAVNEAMNAIYSSSRTLISDQFMQLENKYQKIFLQAMQQSQNALLLLNQLSESLNHKVQISLEEKQNTLEQLSQRIELSDPKRILKKGYGLAYHAGKLIKEAKELKSGDEFELFLSKGSVQSKAIKIKKN